MVALWEEVWGKSDLLLDVKERVKRDPISNRVDDSLINGVVPDECNTMLLPSAVSDCWEIGCDEKIFVRSGEYKEAENAALATSQDPQFHGFLITGQLGIGLFLFPFIIVGS